MKCPYCGSDNRDGAVSCEICEMPLNIRVRKRPAARSATKQPSNMEQITQLVEVN